MTSGSLIVTSKMVAQVIDGEGRKSIALSSDDSRYIVDSISVNHSASKSVSYGEVLKIMADNARAGLDTDYARTAKSVQAYLDGIKTYTQIVTDEMIMKVHRAKGSQSLTYDVEAGLVKMDESGGPSEILTYREVLDAQEVASQGFGRGFDIAREWAMSNRADLAVQAQKAKDDKKALQELLTAIPDAQRGEIIEAIVAAGFSRSDSLPA